MSSRSRTANKSKNSKLLDIINNSYIGIIESVDDPKFEGRCKIRVFGLYGDKNDSLGSIPTEDLPYAYPNHDLVFGSSNGSGKFSTPKVGAKVRVTFEEDHYHPRYFSIEELDPELKAILQEDYENFHSLLFDSDDSVGIYYAKNTGILIDLAGSLLNIQPDGAIIINHRQSSSTIELRGDTITMTTNNALDMTTPNIITANSNQVHINGVQTDIGASPIFSAVNGEILMKLILAISTGLDAKFPTTPGQFASLVTQMEPFILSNTVSTSP